MKSEECKRYDEQLKLLTSFLEEWENGQGISARTSGSTGTPKNIHLSKDHVERSARRTNSFFRIKVSDRIHSCVSFEFIGGKMMIARSLVARCELTYSPPSLTPSPPDKNKPIKLMAVVPAQLPFILDNLADFEHVENFLVGGSAIDDRLWDKISVSGINAWETYGMTETASHIAVRRIAGHSGSRPRFVPLKGINVSIAPDDCLCISDADIFVKTNDIAELHTSNSFTIKGRKDDMIITGGIKVMPQVIEKKLKKHISDLCKEFYISSEPDEIWTSRIILMCVPVEFPGSENNEELISHLIMQRIRTLSEKDLPSKMRPKKIRIIKKLPLTGSGKLIRT